jgi:hypothetical protein
MADVADMAARLGGGDAAHHRLVGDVAQPARLHADLAGEEHAAGVAVPAVEDGGDVDVDDVAVCSRLSPGMPWQTTWLIEVQIDFG